MIAVISREGRRYAIRSYRGRQCVRIETGSWREVRESVGTFQKAWICLRTLPERCDVLGNPLPGFEPPGYDASVASEIRERERVEAEAQ